MNEQVLSEIKKLLTDGSHPYHWVDGFDGVPFDLLYKGEVIARADHGKTYCCGLTLFAAVKAAEKMGLDLGSAKDLRAIKRDWFVATGKRKGPVDALVPRGLGTEIKFEDALPGDMCQIWRRSGSGHSVILINKQPDGFGYWSTQPATNGIGYRAEFFKGVKNPVTEIYIARLNQKPNVTQP